jgi:hypothetical protein
MNVTAPVAEEVEVGASACPVYALPEREVLRKAGAGGN